VNYFDPVLKHVPKPNLEDTKEISILINSVYFFIEFVFILRFHDQYRLVVLHRRKVLTDAMYSTLKGARIAFSRMFRGKSWKEGTKAQWSPFYNPDCEWLSEKTEWLDLYGQERL
jgi:hypothetical protein